MAEPVRLHVEAKRYLCGREPYYHDQLSPASQYTLTQQGGAMSSAEVIRFEAQPYFDEAVQLRRWEAAYGKLADVELPPLSRFRPLFERLETESAQ